jgi:tetratricopeptide (TPR) repeat protein
MNRVKIVKLIILVTAIVCLLGAIGLMGCHWMVSKYKFEGKHLAEARNWDAAREKFEFALKLWPDATIYLNLGIIESASRNYQKALTYCDKALLMNPKMPEAFIQKGKIHYRLKEYDLALAAYKAALRLDPGLSEVRERIEDITSITAEEALANTREENTGQTDGKSGAVEQKLTAENKFEAAILAWKAGRIDEAITLLTALIGDEPDNARALFSLGVLWNDRGQDSDAIRYLRKALDINGLSTNLRNKGNLLLGEIFERNGFMDEALISYYAAKSEDPGGLVARERLASLLTAQGKKHQAINELWELIELKPDASRAYLMCANIYENSSRPGDLALAALFLETYSMFKIPADERRLVNNRIVDLRIRQADYENSLGNYKSAYAALTVAARMRSNDPRLNLQQGIALLGLKQFSRAEQTLRRAREFNPGNIEIHYHLGRAYYFQGKGDMAEREILRVLNASPYHKRALRLMVKIMNELQNNYTRSEYYRDILKALGG